MSTTELQNWLALYVATGILCAIGAATSVVTVAVECYRERIWNTVGDAKSVALFLPRLWWRWQKRYLLGTPAILAIVGWFAASMDWSV